MYVPMSVCMHVSTCEYMYAGMNVCIKYNTLLKTVNVKWNITLLTNIGSLHVIFLLLRAGFAIPPNRFSSCIQFSITNPVVHPVIPVLQC